MRNGNVISKADYTLLLVVQSVNEICFLRGLFPDDCFNGVNLQHLEGWTRASLIL